MSEPTAQSSKPKITATDRLNALLGGNLSKNASITNDVFKAALAKVVEDRNKAAEARATEVIGKALDIQKKMNAADSAHKKNMAAFEKELGGLLKELEAANRGDGSPTPEEEEKEEAKEEPKT